MLCHQGDGELQHCLSTRGEGGRRAGPRMCRCQRRVYVQLHARASRAAFSIPYTLLPLLPGSSTTAGSGSSARAGRAVADGTRGHRGRGEPSQLARQFSTSAGCQSTPQSPPRGCPCLPGWTPQPNAPSSDPCLISSVDNTIKESTTRRACQIETSSSVLLPEQPAGRQNPPVKH